MSKVLDIRPLIKRKRQAACEHGFVSVSDSEASLTCDKCDAEIDPWWFIRRIASDSECRDAEHEARRLAWEAMEADGNRRIAILNATISRLNEEVSMLTEAKNRLWNTQINGRLLGSVARRRARKVAR